MCTDAELVFAGDGDRLGEGVGCTAVVVFELFGAVVQLVKHAISPRIKSRRVLIILGSLISFFTNGATGVPTRLDVFARFSARLANDRGERVYATSAAVDMD